MQVFSWKIKFLCRVSQWAYLQDELIDGKLPVIKLL
jgi:hypothetical protein